MKSLGLGSLALFFAAIPLAAQDTASAPIDTSYVEYHDSPVTLPLGIGLRVPGYDRVNGLTLPWGPRLELGEEKFVVDALVSYRSHLGNWDPSIEATARPAYGSKLDFYIGRGTFTNDAWIRSDLINSAAALFVGSDARNYYRADKVSLRLGYELTRNSFTITPFVGGGLENDWSTGSLAPTRRPWSFFGRDGSLKMRRPNPPVFKRHIGSVIGGGELQYFRDGVDAKLSATAERALSGDGCAGASQGVVCVDNRGDFTQATVHSEVQFPTFGTQTFTFRAHALLSGDNAPPQRFGYLGGASTLATVDLLALGGDHLLYVEGDYKIPLKVFALPFLGGPFVALHYAAGNAGIGKLPALIQNVGVAVGVGPLRVDYAMDPASNRSPFSRRSAVTFGLSLDF
jgi:hypothetical protein